jgi:DNA-binding transcriptional regulator of glucitol operon
MISVRCEEKAMNDITTHLKDEFGLSQTDLLEYWEMKGGLEPDGMTIRDVSTDEENRTFYLLKMLSNTVDAIPLPLVERSEELRRSQPERFEHSLLHMLKAVGYSFFPANAAEFVEELDRTVQSDEVIPDPREYIARLVELVAAMTGK